MTTATATRRGRPRPHPRSRRPVDDAPDPRRRLVALLVVVALATAAVVARLAFVQVLSARGPDDFGRSQRFRTVVLPAERGSIRDRNGVELAMSVRQKTVWADPQQVREPMGAAHALAPLLRVDERVLADRLSANAGFVYLARKVDDGVAAKVEQLHLAGVSLLDEPKRFNPAGSLALPVLGQVGVDDQGLTGLEAQYERQLSGRPGRLLVEHDPAGRRIANAARQLRAPAPGQDLVLTLDRSLQFRTEQALAAQVTASHAKGGIAVVMDPGSGEVLAMANLRAGDQHGPKPAPANAAVTNVFEPGSVNKVVTLAAALQEGVLSPSSRLGVPDHLTVADAVFHEAEQHPTRSWTPADILANSSNVGTIMVGERLGRTRLDAYLHDFGFGTRTGLGFPGESGGLVRPVKDWSGTSVATVSIGQGVAVTAVQMLAAYNTIANGGVYVAPRLVKGMVDAQGRMHPTKQAPRRQVVSGQTAAQVTAMLEEVVRSGTGTAAAVDGYAVAGKTGTARKPLERARGYKAGAYVATFAGFAPARAPRLSAIVMLDEPTPIYGGVVSAPVFSQLAADGLRFLRVPPDNGQHAVGPAAPAGSPGDAVRGDADDVSPVAAPTPAATLGRSATTTP